MSIANVINKYFDGPTSVSQGDISVTTLADDLGADSLDLVEIVMALKKNSILRFR